MYILIVKEFKNLQEFDVFTSLNTVNLLFDLVAQDFESILHFDLRWPVGIETNENPLARVHQEQVVVSILLVTRVVAAVTKLVRLHCQHRSVNQAAVIHTAPVHAIAMVLPERFFIALLENFVMFEVREPRVDVVFHAHLLRKRVPIGGSRIGIKNMLETLCAVPVVLRVATS